ncbi:MAG: tRNA lysidine(34) synthetase TilS [Metamycoplasmataceae bacterium]
MKNKYLLAVSGGVDSMILLHKNKSKNIIVAFVNYNLRPEAKIEEEIVKNFCIKNNIKFYIHSATFEQEGNFQNWAREERYKFFKEIYDLENCSKLLLAHHKDDFLETYFLNKNVKRTPYFWGIKKNNNLFEMKISRPFINKYYKNQLYKIAKRKNISFNDDKSNFEEKYSRNKIRKELISWSVWKKEILFITIKTKNFFLIIRNKRIDNIYKKWEKDNFSISFLKENEKLSFDLVFNYLIDKYKGVKISSEKVNSIKAFIFAKNEAKKIYLGRSYFLYKDNKYIYNVLNE